MWRYPSIVVCVCVEHLPMVMCRHNHWLPCLRETLPFGKLKLLSLLATIAIGSKYMCTHTHTGLHLAGAINWCKSAAISPLCWFVGRSKKKRKKMSTFWLTGQNTLNTQLKSVSESVSPYIHFGWCPMVCAQSCVVTMARQDKTEISFHQTLLHCWLSLLSPGLLS